MPTFVGAILTLQICPMTIRTIQLSSPIGNIEICGDESAIHYVSFVDNKEPETGEYFPILLEAKKQLEQYFAGKLKKFTVPFKQEGTTFQQDVWGQLSMIPYGRTSSYIEIARKISNEKSVRAVGATNGRNSLLIIVPCHRIIGQNGELNGYVAGVWRKKWLLDHEAKIAHGVQKLF